jgi:hypothetical protein
VQESWLWKRFNEVASLALLAVGTYYAVAQYYRESPPAAPSAPLATQASVMPPWWVIALLGLGLALLVIRIALTVPWWLQRRQPKSLDTSKKAEQPPPQTINPLETYFSKKIIRLVDLIYDEQYEVKGKTFEDCVIFGPALIAFVPPGNISDCTWRGDPDSLFIEVVPKERAIGIVGIKDCTFRRCRFVGIGMIGPKEAVEHWKKGFKQSPD